MNKTIPEQMASKANPELHENFSCTVLRECIELQRKKAHDYQNAKSTVKQIDYYPHGLQSIYDICHAKMLRIRSLMESGATPENEALEDSFRDLINYSSFAVSYLHGKIPGQEK